MHGTILQIPFGEKRGQGYVLTFFAVVFIGFVALCVLAVYQNVKSEREEAAKLQSMTPEERERYRIQKAEAARRAQERIDQSAYGPLNQAMVCPHCQTKGYIRTKAIERKKGISGGKATAAILTGGVSMLATGLSPKEELTQARCGSCKNIWAF